VFALMQQIPDEATRQAAVKALTMTCGLGGIYHSSSILAQYGINTTLYFDQQIPFVDMSPITDIKTNIDGLLAMTLLALTIKTGRYLQVYEPMRARYTAYGNSMITVGYYLLLLLHWQCAFVVLSMGIFGSFVNGFNTFTESLWSLTALLLGNAYTGARVIYVAHSFGTAQRIVAYAFVFMYIVVMVFTASAMVISVLTEAQMDSTEVIRRRTERRAAITVARERNESEKREFEELEQRLSDLDTDQTSALARVSLGRWQRFGYFVRRGKDKMAFEALGVEPTEPNTVRGRFDRWVATLPRWAQDLKRGTTRFVRAQRSAGDAFGLKHGEDLAFNGDHDERELADVPQEALVEVGDFMLAKRDSLSEESSRDDLVQIRETVYDETSPTGLSSVTQMCRQRSRQGPTHETYMRPPVRLAKAPKHRPAIVHFDDNGSEAQAVKGQGGYPRGQSIASLADAAIALSVEAAEGAESSSVSKWRGLTANKRQLAMASVASPERSGRKQAQRSTGVPRARVAATTPSSNEVSSRPSDDANRMVPEALSPCDNANRTVESS